MSTVRDEARRHIKKGRAPVPLPYKSKVPALDEWQNLRLQEADLEEYFDGSPQNLGVILGAPSGDCTDVDLDAHEAVSLADDFLPKTRSVFGRSSKPRSHREYTCLITTEKFADVTTPDGETAMVVEIRSTGGQTMFPPSVHPSGEPVEWAEDGEPARVDPAELRRAVVDLACAALLARHWPGPGARHETALAAAGLLARAGVDDARVVTIVAGAARAAGDAEWADRKRAALDTVSAVRAGEASTGGPRLAELLAGGGAKVVERLRRWLGSAATTPSSQGGPPAVPTVWTRAKTAAELLDAGGATVDWLDFPLVARGSLTAINAPRGTGKSAVVLGRMVARARAGLRVLYCDRDNSPATLRKRLRGTGAGDVPTLRVLTRDAAPALADVAAWRAFPLDAFDVVVLDSWDAFAEGAGEQDSRRSTLALAPLLDMVRRERAPGVIVLCNVTKDGAAGRGSGVLEDRMDNVFEARDVTGFAPSGRRAWWEELPPAARGEWAARATRRSGRARPERIRVALIGSKCRDDDDPAPFVLELDFTGEPWVVRDVTAELVVVGDTTRAAELAQAAATRDRSAEALAAELARRAAEGGRPVLKKPAEALLMAHGLTSRGARELLKAGGGGRWRLEPLDGRALAVVSIAAPLDAAPARISTPPGICTLARVPEPSNAGTRMDIERPNSNSGGPAKNAGAEMVVDAGAPDGNTATPSMEDEV